MEAMETPVLRARRVCKEAVPQQDGPGSCAPAGRKSVRVRSRGGSRI